jgi:anti-sigma factor RsiW
MSAPWSITATGAAAQASASQAAPNAPYQNRLRAIQCTLSGTAVGAVKIVVRDGASGAGAIIGQFDLSIPTSNGPAAILALTGLDLRASPGNALTLESTGSGGANTTTDVNGQGDIVPVGWPAYQ